MLPPRPSAALLLGLALFACSGEGRSSDPRTISRQQMGDTTLVTIPRGLDTTAVVVDSVRILWQDPALERPRALAIADDQVVIGDPTKLHFLTRDGAYRAGAGRPGEGPEDFGSVLSVGVAGDTVAALDSRNHRIALLDTGAVFRNSVRYAPSDGFVNPRSGAALRFYDGGVLLLMTENVHLDRSTKAGLAWLPLSGGPSRILRTWDDIRWMDAEGVLVPDRVFGPRAHVAVSADGRIAWGDGLDYCVELSNLKAPSVLRVCRERPRSPLTSGARDVSVSGLELLPEVGAAIARQAMPESFPSFDRLLFAEDGRLWVRALGAEGPDAHPSLVRWKEDALPSLRRWEALDPTGAPAGAVLLPDAFDPMVFDGEAAFGFLELVTGELVLAVAEWGAL